MIYTGSDLRPNPQYPTYPPYHQGEYLEDYFYSQFVTNKPQSLRNYIGVSWTTLYCDNKDQNLQLFLDSLDPNEKYFTVMQHDDAPKHRLPKDTLCFSAGGNVRGENIIPIPLICSSLPYIKKNEEKTLLASFVGSLTHPIRNDMAHHLNNKPNCEIKVKNWSPHVDNNEFNNFINLASKSKFLLCPRGYGLNSFRLYEAFQLGCVPVIITDILYLPWTDELNWQDFSVIIHASNVDKIYDILNSIDQTTYNNMINKGIEVYDKYFTLNGMYQNIIKRIYI
jgi:hypothetical protein